MNEDWLDLLNALAEGGARFLIVGAHALAVHGVPRGTQDLDIWIDTSSSNVDRVWQALVTFGAPLGSLNISREDFARPDTVIQIGVPPNRVDLLTSLTGLPDFDEAWSSRVTQVVSGRVIPFLGRSALVTNKRATGRRKDLGDLEALGELPPS